MSDGFKADDGDVIVASVIESFFVELFACLLRRGVTQNGSDVIVGDIGAEAVAAEEKGIGEGSCGGGDEGVCGVA